MRLVGRLGDDISLDLLTFVLFLVSFVHPASYVLFEVYLLALGLVISPVYVNILKSLLVISIRGMMNDQIAAASGLTALMKWVVLMGLSVYAIFLFAKSERHENRVCHRYWHMMALFCIYCCIAALAFSSYPTAAIFKVISYSIPFYATYICISRTSKNFDWIVYIAKISVVTCLLSLTWRDAHYYNHDHIWTGLFPNPNGYAQMLVFAFTTCLVTYNSKKRIVWLVLAGLMFLIDLFLAGSRTCLAAMACVGIVWLLFLPVSRRKKGVILFFVVVLGVLVIALSFPLLKEIFISFFYKWGDSMGLLGSRISQFSGVLDRFLKNPLFGTGFNVPYEKGQVDFGMYLSLPVENGNFILAILGDTGVIGFILYMTAAIYLFVNTRTCYWPLFFCPYLIAVGEMLLFSTNSFGVFVYVLLSVCLVNNIRNETITSDTEKNKDVLSL